MVLFQDGLFTFFTFVLTLIVAMGSCQVLNFNIFKTWRWNLLFFCVHYKMTSITRELEMVGRFWLFRKWDKLFKFLTFVLPGEFQVNWTWWSQIDHKHNFLQFRENDKIFVFLIGSTIHLLDMASLKIDEVIRVSRKTGGPTFVGLFWHAYYCADSTNKSIKLYDTTFYSFMMLLSKKQL